MSPTWRQLWQHHPEIDALFAPLKPSAAQLALIEDLSPLDVPAFGLEVSRVAGNRRPQLALLLLSGRAQRWRQLFAAYLRPDGCLAPGIALEAIQPLIATQPWLQPDTWLEWSATPRRSQGGGFMLFRRLAASPTLQELEPLCHALAQGLSPALQQRVGLPSPAWFAALARLPLGTLDQWGISVDPGSSGWRFLFSSDQPVAVLESCGLPEAVTRCLAGSPLHFSFDSRWMPTAACGVEVLPHYRRTSTVTAYPGEVPTGQAQWPTWPSQPVFWASNRYLRMVDGSVHLPSGTALGRSLGLRGGLSHQKLVIRAGEVIDHKLYVGLMVSQFREAEVLGSSGSARGLNSGTAQREALRALAAQRLAEAPASWFGFPLQPGASDLWIPLACLVLAASAKQAPDLASTYERMQATMAPVLEAAAPVGYATGCPPDLDSTLWLLRCRTALGYPRSASLEQWVASAWTAAGLPTYPSAAEIAAFIAQPIEGVSGWCSPHDCVTSHLAADPALPGSVRALQLVRQTLRSGRFQSYWWPLDGLALVLLPRGCLPASVVQRVAQQVLSPPCRAVMPADQAERLERFVRALLLLRHGALGEQQGALAACSALIQRPADFAPLLVLQVPEPQRVQADQQPSWIWNGRQQGTLVSDPYGYFAASLLLHVLQG